MAGSYCRYCDRRCFLDRLLPLDATWRPGEYVHLATCTSGKTHDELGTGYTADTAINPRLPLREQPEPHLVAWRDVLSALWTDVTEPDRAERLTAQLREVVDELRGRYRQSVDALRQGERISLSHAEALAVRELLERAGVGADDGADGDCGEVLTGLRERVDAWHQLYGRMDAVGAESARLAQASQAATAAAAAAAAVH